MPRCLRAQHLYPRLVIALPASRGSALPGAAALPFPLLPPFPAAGPALPSGGMGIPSLPPGAPKVSGLCAAPCRAGSCTAGLGTAEGGSLRDSVLNLTGIAKFRANECSCSAGGGGHFSGAVLSELPANGQPGAVPALRVSHCEAVGQSKQSSQTSG